MLRAADRFDGDAADVFELQDRITETVVGAIEPKVQLAEIDRLRHKAAPDLTAYAPAMALGAYCYAALRPVELGKNDADVL